VIGKIYADWCGHCTALKPEWAKMKQIIQTDLAKYLKNITVEFAEIEQTDEAAKVAEINRKFLHGFASSKVGLQGGYPTIFKIHEGKVHYYPSEKERKSMELAEWFVHGHKKGHNKGHISGGGRRSKRKLRRGTRKSYRK